MAKVVKKRIQIGNIPFLYLDSDLFQGTLKQIAQAILDLEVEFKEAYDLGIQKGKNYFPYDQIEELSLDIMGDDGSVDIMLSAYRTETDEEYKLRRKAENEYKEKLKIQQETRERQQFEALKAKYGS